MSVDPQQIDRAVRKERTNDAFSVAEPVQNPRIAPRVIPVIVAVLIGVAIIALLFLFPR